MLVHFDIEVIRPDQHFVLESAVFVLLTNTIELVDDGLDCRVLIP